jgi:hypothetical protein
MGLKESAIQDRFCQRFEAELTRIGQTLQSGRGKRKYDYIQERVIRLKERFKAVSSFYSIEITREDEKS